MKRLLLSVLTLAVLAIGAPSFAADATLQWTANTETDLSGYKFYRGNATGAGTCPIGPLQPLMVGGVAASVGKVTTYIDSTVPTFDGQLCYELTAFDTSGNESTHSVRAVKAVNLVPPVAPVGLTIPSVVP